MKYKTFDTNQDELNFTFDYNSDETKILQTKNYSNLDLNTLRQIALWKNNRVLGVEESLLDSLRELPNCIDLQIDSFISKRIIKELVNCQGIGYPLASAILKFIRPDVFPIIDVRAYRALYGKKISYHQYNFDLYLEYSKKVQALAVHFDLPLKNIDEQLYMFDKTHNGKI